eukprot:TRINITY_DN3673_c0_g1_i9.p1 TRINITY_DN3673_c0_g1~~TRINITY_DN3673_c0_g1_i9.p1  ORF type:complete len:883 (+),score=199.98 TRINITY_DN3673_c0_g1_i9:60-2708(+)
MLNKMRAENVSAKPKSLISGLPSSRGAILEEFSPFEQLEQIHFDCSESETRLRNVIERLTAEEKKTASLPLKSLFSGLIAQVKEAKQFVSRVTNGYDSLFDEMSASMSRTLAHKEKEVQEVMESQQMRMKSLELEQKRGFDLIKLHFAKRENELISLVTKLQDAVNKHKAFIENLVEELELEVHEQNQRAINQRMRTMGMIDDIENRRIEGKGNGRKNRLDNGEKGNAIINTQLGKENVGPMPFGKLDKRGAASKEVVTERRAEEKKLLEIQVFSSRDHLNKDLFFDKISPINAIRAKEAGLAGYQGVLEHQRAFNPAELPLQRNPSQRVNTSESADSSKFFSELSFLHNNQGAAFNQPSHVDYNQSGISIRKEEGGWDSNLEDEESALYNHQSDEVRRAITVLEKMHLLDPENLELLNKAIANRNQDPAYLELVIQALKLKEQTVQAPKAKKLAKDISERQVFSRKKDVEGGSKGKIPGLQVPQRVKGDPNANDPSISMILAGEEVCFPPPLPQLTMAEEHPFSEREVQLSDLLNAESMPMPSTLKGDELHPLLRGEAGEDQLRDSEKESPAMTKSLMKGFMFSRNGFSGQRLLNLTKLRRNFEYDDHISEREEFDSKRHTEGNVKVIEDWTEENPAASIIEQMEDPRPMDGLPEDKESGVGQDEVKQEIFSRMPPASATNPRALFCITPNKDRRRETGSISTKGYMSGGNLLPKMTKKDTHMSANNSLSFLQPGKMINEHLAYLTSFSNSSLPIIHYNNINIVNNHVPPNNISRMLGVPAMEENEEPDLLNLSFPPTFASGTNRRVMIVKPPKRKGKLFETVESTFKQTNAANSSLNIHQNSLKEPRMISTGNSISNHTNSASMSIYSCLLYTSPSPRDS